MKQKTMVIMITAIALICAVAIGLNVYYDNVADQRVDIPDENIPNLPAMPEATPEPAVTPTVVVNETVNETVNDTTNESVYDTHNASWLYANGYYGGNSGSSEPESPIPEMLSFTLFAIGLIALAYIIDYKYLK